MTAATLRRSSRAPTATGAEDRLPLLALSEIALAAVMLAAVLGLRRAFLPGDWLAPLLLQVVGAHALAITMRRRGLPALASVPATVVAAALAITWIYAGETSVFGIPTGDTVDVLSTAVRDAATVFSDVKAPTDALPGFLIATSVTIWLGAALSDWAAFQVNASLEATLPSATLFVLTAILGADIDRVLLAVLWTVTVMVFLLLRRADRLGITARWVGERRGRGPRSLLLLGVSLIAVAVAVAGLLGPRLPGADSDAVLSLTDIGDDGPDTRVTVSPLVDIRSRLIEQADVEVFSVRSPERSYWRLTSLDRFDGRIWSSTGSYGSADGELDDGVSIESPRTTFEQSYSISSLAQIWLPAAYEPQAISAGEDIRYDEVSSTLIVDTDIESSDNVDYRVTSALPVHDPEALAAASTEIPDDIAERYLELPGGFSDRVRDLASQITMDSSTPYESALALQNFFRANFTYDLDVGTGHSDEAIENFLFEQQRGYCEQFAGSYAAMARSLGIPARVAVGFTPGTAADADPGLYRVRGENAHAWPEVYLGEYGWVSFEPTPGRGAPFAEQYTGVPEQQAAAGDPSSATTAPAPATTTPESPAESSPTTRPDQLPEDLEAETSAPAGETGASNPWFGRLAWAAGLLVAGVALYLVAVLGAVAWRRHRRRAAAVTPTQRLALAWDDSIRAARRAGTTIRDTETQRETAARITGRLPEAAEAITTLAAAVENGMYAPAAPSDDDGARALTLAGDVEQAATDSLRPTERARRTLHPRRLLGD
ncbi:MAG: DUF3488 and transglutaminase-like domain-containing protein [Acidimicrobiales bacterium]|nr:DUF3488 and transglutaminase-like domain-containing protein [Acidimicrobiales bacterium]